MPMNDQLHQPVLAQEVLTILKPKLGDSYLDLTAGYGGHASLVAGQVGTNGSLTLVDRDVEAVHILAEKFGSDERVRIYQNDYQTASRGLIDSGELFDCILADIGVSSPHLDNPDRGFSYMQDGPLDMRMDRSQELTAQTIVNEWSAEDLVTVLRDFGEVRHARKIVRSIEEKRPLATTSDLASIIKACTPSQYHKRVLSQVFQAMRIAVNGELTQLGHSLPLWHKLLKPGGRLAVISFHSLEDRMVKQYFAEYASKHRYDSDLVLLTKRSIVCTPEQLVINPRARSAKLRAVQRK